MKKLLLTTIFFFCCLISSKAQSIVATVAGNGVYSYSGDGGQATAAQLYWPNKIAIDGLGNLYIADLSNHRIRKVTTTGVISTVAGNGVAGYSGDGGQATVAQLNQPRAIAVDLSGNIYIADAYNNVIRKVSSGIITTIIGTGTGAGLGYGFYTGDGGPATNAELFSPEDVKVDAASNIYIVDRYHNIVRKVNALGIINTVAGNGFTITGGVGSYSGDGGLATAAELSGIEGIAIDGFGNIYISDRGNARIRKVNTSGIINTIAGTGIHGFSGDGSIATSAELVPLGITLDISGNIYFGDSSQRIRKIDVSGVINSLAGNGIAGYSGDGGAGIFAKIYDPSGVDIDGSGNIYITNRGTNHIRKISTSSIISTVAGNGCIKYSGDGGQAVDAELNGAFFQKYDLAGNLYIADYGNDCIRTVTSSGIISIFAGNRIPGYSGDGGMATTAQLFRPSGIATDAIGNVYISDAVNGCIRIVRPSGIISTIAGNGTSGYMGDGGPATNAQLYNPLGLTVDGSGNIYVADAANNCIRVVRPSGIISTFAGTGIAGYSGDGSPATSAQLTNPYDVAVDAIGNLYIADYGNNCIRIVRPSGVISTLAGTGVAGYSGDGGVAIAAELSGPRSVIVDAIGNIFVSDGDSAAIRMVNTSGIITTIAGNGIGYNGEGLPATATKFNLPAGLSFDGLGNLCIADLGNDRIRKICSGTLPFAGAILGSTTVCLDSTETLINTVSGGIWSMTNSHATISGGILTGISPGVDTIVYTVSNACGMASTSFEVSVINCDTVTRIRSLNNRKKEVINISPNPNKGDFTVNFSTITTFWLNVTITNVFGQKVKEMVTTSDSPIQIHLDVPSGVYYLNVICKEGVMTNKLIIDP